MIMMGEGLKMIVNMGDDADTVGAVFGQLGGAYYSADLIPLRYEFEFLQSSST